MKLAFWLFETIRYLVIFSTVFWAAIAAALCLWTKFAFFSLFFLFLFVTRKAAFKANREWFLDKD